MRKILGKKNAVIALLACFICLFASLGFSVVMPAKADGLVETTKSEYDTYTDSDQVLYYSDKTIRDYPDSLYATQCRICYNEEGILDLENAGTDDPIVGIVPKDLFSGTGRVLHIGKEYGFFIDTEIIAKKYVSTVMVFDIDTNTNFDETTDRVIVKVQPVFQYKYVYLKATESSFGFNGKNLDYNLTEDRVTPYPRSILEDRVNFGMTKEYYLKDVSYGETLYNENNLNRGDICYNPYNDYGSFFTAVDYTYNGKSREKGDFPVEASVSLTLDCVGIVFSKAPVIGTMMNVLTIGTDIISLGAGIIDQNYGHEVSVSSGKLTTRCFYQNRDDQLAHYKDSEGNPILTKVAGLTVNTPDDKSVWYGTGDDVTGYFTVSHSALNGQVAEYTRLVQEIALKVVRVSGDTEVAADTSSYSHFLRKQNTKEVVNGEADGYTIKDGYDRFSFAPSESEYYKIVNHGISPLNIKISVEKDDKTFEMVIEKQVMSKESLRVLFDKTKEYRIEAGGIRTERDFHIFPLTFELDPERIEPEETKEVTIKGNSLKWYRFTEKDSEVSVFSTDKGNISITIYDRNMKPVVNNAMAINSPELLTEADKTYFIKLENLSDTVQTTSFVHSYKSGSVIGGDLYSEPRYFKMKIEILGTYRFELKSNSSLDITVYNNNHVTLYTTRSLQFLYTFERTGEYILGVKRVNGVSGNESVSYGMQFTAENIFFGKNILTYNEALTYNIYRFKPKTTTEYIFSSGSASVRVMKSLTGDGDLNGGILSAGTNYYVKVENAYSGFELNVGLAYCGVLKNGVIQNGTFGAEESVFYRFTTANYAGKYTVELLNAQLAVFDRNLEYVHITGGNVFYGQETAEYYLKLVGVYENNYSVKCYFDPPELKINKGQAISSDTYFKFTNDTLQVFIIRTFGDNTASAKVKYSTDLENFTESDGSTNFATMNVTWDANIYYIYVEVGGKGYVGVSIAYADPEKYFEPDYKLPESEMYWTEILRLETRCYSVTVPEADSGKNYEVRLSCGELTTYQLAVDGKFIKCEFFERGLVERYTFSLTKGNHTISIQYDTNAPTGQYTVTVDQPRLIFMKQIEDLDFYLTETESGVYTRDGIRPGYSYNIQLIANGKIVSEYFTVKDVDPYDDISVDGYVLKVRSEAEYDKEKIFLVNFAFVNYYISVDTVYPYLLVPKVEKNDNEILYKIEVLDYYTGESILTSGQNTLVKKEEIAKISDILMKVDIGTTSISEQKITSLNRYNGLNAFVFDLSELNYYQDANINCVVTLKNGTADRDVDLPTTVLPYRTSGSINNFDPSGKKILYFDLTTDPIDVSKYAMNPIVFPESVKVVNIKGNGDEDCFNGFKFSGDIVLNLYHVSLKGAWNGAPVRSDNNVTINALGQCSIDGGDGYFGTMQAQATPAIVVKDLTLRVPKGSHLSITGGLPYLYNFNGSVGTTGSTGKNGADGTSDSKNGEDGKTGGAGGTGEMGRTGTTGVKCNILDISGVDGKNVTIKGSVGCLGGTGGKGGTGGNGGDGKAVGWWGQASGNGADGGQGGVGGTGGKGGTGGTGIECKSIKDSQNRGIDNVVTISGGKGGQGGAGGKGGNGGKGGSGGAKPSVGGHAGSDGHDGTVGNSGKTGESGSVGAAIKYV